MSSGNRIVKLHFNKEDAVALPAGNGFNIYLKNTTDASFSASLPWTTAIAGADLVYSGDPSSIVGSTSGWKEFALTTPFIYTGGNLQVMFEYIQDNGPSSTINWYYSSSSTQPEYVSNSTRYSSSTTLTPPTNVATGTTNHPHIKIEYQTSC